MENVSNSAHAIVTYNASKLTSNSRFLILDFNFCSEHETNEPIILIDLKGWGYNMLRLDEWNVALGVRSNNFNKRFLKFFQKMSEAGAKFVFFVVGRKQTDDSYCTEIQSRTTELDSEYHRYIQMMDAIENETEFLPKIHVHDLLNYTKSNIEHMCRDLGEFHVSHSLHNWEIAEYLCNQPVMAIITDDSDFMAIDGEFEYWSLGNINFDTMDGARYNKDQLNSKLDLIPQRVHSVDVLTGSDSTPSHFSSEFGELLNRLTSWYTWKSNRNLHEESELMEFCKTKYPIMYMLHTYEFFEIAEIVSVDFRMFRIYSYADMVVPVVMKLCGILSNDEPSRPQTRTIFAKFAHEDSAVVRHEDIIYPSSNALPSLINFFPIFTISSHLFYFTVELPSTYELIANPEDMDYDEYRWSLLAWVLNLDHDLVTKIRQMNQPNNIKVAVISLQYLFQVNKENLIFN